MRKEELFNKIIETLGVITERSSEDEITNYTEFLKKNKDFNAEMKIISNEEWRNNDNSTVYLPKDKSNPVTFIHNEINDIVKEIAKTNENIAVEFRHQTNLKILKDFIIAKIYMSPDTTADEAIFVAELLTNIIYAKLENYECEYNIVKLYHFYKKASAKITIDESFIDRINYWYDTLMAA